MRKLARTLPLAALPLALLAATAAPASAAPPDPVAGSPSCGGLLVSYFNHLYGWTGPSGNANASAGPGLHFAPGTALKIHADRDRYC